ncbi:MAG: hypothetical protein IJX20_02245 [Alphaproteobacteria bacterium]|nr:hypothetical protein [Alphaproteobacteria bacterium]
MSEISINISKELQSKLIKVANKTHRTFDECVELALREYADNYDDFYKTDFCSVDNAEKAFFFAAAE